MSRYITHNGDVRVKTYIGSDLAEISRTVIIKRLDEFVEFIKGRELV